MSDDIHDRRTPVPRDVPPPWERGTTPGADFGKTQPLKTPTAEDVLEVFSLFQKHLLSQIDKRDERILLAIQDIGTRIVEHYERETARGDEHARLLKQEAKRGEDHAKWIGQLRHRTHKLSNEQQATNIRLAYIEQRLGIEPPLSPLSPLPEEPPEPET